MARVYWIQCPITWADGDAMDAWTARVRLQQNPESVYEECRFDQTIILYTYIEILSDKHHRQIGPIPVPMRRDRTGAWRKLGVNILAAGGTNAVDFFATLLHRRQYWAYDASDNPLAPYVTWTVSSGTTLAWQTAKNINPYGTWWDAERKRFPGDDEEGIVDIAWLTIHINADPSGPNHPRIGGVHMYEVIEDEP